MILSICIPTYNRPESLYYCLKSLSAQKTNQFEVCISDNGSSYNIAKIVEPFKKKLKIKFSRNKKNLGFAINLLKVVSMAKGKFVWLLGDDDLLVEGAVKTLIKRIKNNNNVKFFWVNSYFLHIQNLKKFGKKFDIKFLPKNLKRHSDIKKNKVLNFFDLIDKKISFDYLLGIFVCVFDRRSWNENLHVVDYKLIKDIKTWSNFENTCFFIKVFCSAFSNSKAYLQAKPLTVSLHGVREWSSLYPFVEIVRIPEALDYYRSQGLNFWVYILNKNFALRNFFNYFFKIFLYGNKMGLNYVNFRKHFLYNLIYPNSWMSILYFLKRKFVILLNLNKK